MQAVTAALTSGLELALQSGARISREVMERGNAVAVLGHDPNRNEVVLGKEFRPGVLVAPFKSRERS
jgi:hypothetical protein